MLEEIEKYRKMKEEIRRKHLSAATSMIDDETKKRAHSERKRRDASLFRRNDKKARLIRVFICLNCVCMLSSSPYPVMPLAPFGYDGEQSGIILLLYCYELLYDN